MKKKFLAILLTLIVTVALLTVGASAAESGKITVSGAITGEYGTITAAIAAVNAAEGSDAITVTIPAGTYAATDEDKDSRGLRWSIIRNNVTVQGAGVDETTLNCGSVQAMDGQASIVLGANNVTLKDMTILSTVAADAIKVTALNPIGNQGIELLTGCKLENLKVSSEKGNGINIHGVDGCTVDNVNIVKKGKCGISVANALDVEITEVKTPADSGWGYDIGMQYDAENAQTYYANASTVTLGAGNSFGKGVIYGSHPDGDTLTLDAEYSLKLINTVVKNSSNLTPVSVEAMVELDNGTYYGPLAAAVAAAQLGDTVTLLDDVTTSSLVNLDKAITLDLGGKTITRAGVVNAPTLYITADATVKNGAVKNTGNGMAIWVAVGAASLEDVDVTGSDYGIHVAGSTLNADSATTITGTNTTSECGDGIRVYRGTVNYAGTITASSSGTAIELYGNAAKATVSGEVKGAYGVVVYGGTLTVTGTVTGNTCGIETSSDNAETEKITNATVTVSGGTVNGGIKANKNHTNGDYSTIAITGGNVNGALTAAASETIAISGGTFSVDPFAYLAPGYKVEGTYNVVKLVEVDEDSAAADTVVVPSVGTTDATVSESVSAEVKDDVSTAVSGTTTEGLETVVTPANTAAAAEKVTEEQLTAATTELGDAPENAETHIHVQTYLDITVEGAETTTTEGQTTITSLTLNITPMVQTVVSYESDANELVTSGTEQNAVIVGEEKVEVNTPVTISIPVPGALAGEGQKIYIVHIKDNGEQFVHEVTVENGKATFENTNGFSVFSLLSSAPKAAAYNADGTPVGSYTSLQAAADAAPAGGTVKLLANIDEDNAVAPVLIIDDGDDITLDLNSFNITSDYDYYTIDISDDPHGYHPTQSFPTSGKLTIIGAGTIANDGDSSTVIRNYGTLTIGETGKASPTVIVSGTGNDTARSAVKNEEASILVINDGQFYGNANGARSLQNWGTATISGGTFGHVIQNRSFTSGETTYASVTTITGGTFNGEITENTNDPDNTIVISGGTFSVAPADEYIKDGYQLSGGTVSKTPSAYRITVASAENGTVETDYKSARAGRKVTVTVTADEKYVVKGLTVKTATGRTIAVTDNEDGTYTFTMPGAAVTITAEFGIPFTDIEEDHKFYEAIEWVYVNGLMIGKTEDTFDRASDVSRQQVWMVLGRIQGADPENMAAAKEWAMAQGITDGTRPGEAATREEFITMMWKAFGAPEADTAVLEKFSDADAISADAKTAMAWAVEVGITEGYEDGTMRPAATTTRGAFAAVLYRYLAK